MAIKAIVTDLDGVLTDGGMYYSAKTGWDVANGETHEIGLIKKFHTRDASAARWLSEKTGVKLFVVTAGEHARNNAINASRMEVMYLAEPISQGVMDKLVWLKNVAHIYGLELSEIAYIGDDIIDIGCLSVVGFPSCPADALTSVIGKCNWVSSRNGGYGVLGDLADQWRRFKLLEEKDDG